MNETNKTFIQQLDRILPKSILDKCNILIIDDKQKNLNAFKGEFRREANVFTASNKKEALEVVTQNKIDYVFCDYKMPKFKGSDILKEIVELYPNIKRTVVTAYYDSDIVKEFKEKANTDDIILKPYSFDDIIVRIFGLNRA